MAGLIPQPFIDDLLARTNIVDIVNARVPLKRAGSNHKACCPFHDEKTPSFTVNEAKQFYYCFGCGAAGNALGFIMEYDSCTFPEAVEALAKPLGLEVPRDEQAQKRQELQTPLLNTLKAAQQFYSQSLRKHPAATTAIEYLKNRGLTGHIARDFGVGFAPPGWQNLLNALSDQSKTLIESGMVIEAQERNYDRFRNRITFPIRNTKGDIVGFGGRVINKEDQPKYLNSPETPVFNKGRELYGLFEAKRATRKLEQLLVVEGYMDVIALAQFGINYAVATLGTAVGPAHLQNSFKYCKTITFCFDGDNAGRKAAKKALEVSLPYAEADKTLRFMFLPEGHDPDSLIREIGKEAFENTVSQAQSLTEFLFSTAAEGQALNTVDQRAKFAKSARQLIELMDDEDYKHLMLNELSQRSGIRSQATSPATPKQHPPIPAPDESYAPAPASQYQKNTPIRQRRPNTQTLAPITRVCALVLHAPPLVNLIDFDTLEIDDLDAKTWLQDIQNKVAHNPKLTTGALLGYTLRQEDNNFAKQLLRHEKLWPQSGAEAELGQILTHMAAAQRKERLSNHLAELKAKPFADLSAEEKEQLKQLLLKSSQ